jgi:hypothetical protein
VELDWLPFNKSGGPSFWPWLNAKLSLQYVIHTEFKRGGPGLRRGGPTGIRQQHPVPLGLDRVLIGPTVGRMW